MKAAGESRLGDGGDLVTAAEGERAAIAARISQAEGPRAGGRPGESGTDRRRRGNTLRLGTGRKKQRSPETGGIGAWRDSHRTQRPMYRRCWTPSGSGP